MVAFDRTPLTASAPQAAVPLVRPFSIANFCPSFYYGSGRTVTIHESGKIGRRIVNLEHCAWVSSDCLIGPQVLLSVLLCSSSSSFYLSSSLANLVGRPCGLQCRFGQAEAGSESQENYKIRPGSQAGDSQFTKHCVRNAHSNSSIGVIVQSQILVLPDQLFNFHFTKPRNLDRVVLCAGWGIALRDYFVLTLLDVPLFVLNFMCSWLCAFT